MTCQRHTARTRLGPWLMAVIFIVLLFWQGTVLNDNRANRRLQEARMRAVVTTAQDAVIICDDKQYIVMANHLAGELLDMNQSELLGRKITDFMLPSAATKHSMKYLKSVEAAAGMPNENAIRSRKDLFGEVVTPRGKRIPVQVFASTVKYSDRVEVIARLRRINKLPPEVKPVVHAGEELPETPRVVIPAAVPDPEPPKPEPFIPPASAPDGPITPPVIPTPDPTEPAPPADPPKPVDPPKPADPPKAVPAPDLPEKILPAPVIPKPKLPPCVPCR